MLLLRGIAEVGKTISLASLSDGMPGLTPANGIVLAEAAAVCLEDRTHRTDVQLRLAGMTNDTFALARAAVDEQQRRCYNDLQEATEQGDCGIAILMVKELTGQVVVERSRKGPGFDYWLGADDDDLLFSGKARLEVSGILSGGTSHMEARVKQKRDQMIPSDRLAPGYIVVVEFSHPAVHVETT